MKNQIDPGDPVNENLYEMSAAELRSRGIETLPQNLNEAIDALEADRVIMDALGPVAQTFVDLKRMEWVEYMRHVSDWEIKTYLEFF
jgi:glutamine synthetase